MGTTRHQQAYIVSAISIILFTFLGCLSGYFFLKFYRLNKQVAKDPTTNALANNNIGRFDEAKQFFFAVLCIASFLELPGYAGCIATQGPQACVWYSPSYLVFWYFHLIALSGFTTCIVIPCVLWSDMINKKDGKIFYSRYPYDFIKQYFRASLIVFYINIFLTIIVTAAYYRIEDRDHYYNAPTYLTASLVESILGFLISCGCLYCGLKLQFYVKQAKLRTSVELKFLLTLNIVMIMIVLTLLGRAILIFGLSVVSPEYFDEGISYTMFTFISRWLPFFVCPLSLIYIMRHSSEEINQRNALMNNAPDPNAAAAGTITTTNNPMLPRKTSYTSFNSKKEQHSYRNSKFVSGNSSSDFDVEADSSNPSTDTQELSPAVILAKQLKGQNIEGLTQPRNSSHSTSISFGKKRINSEDSFIMTSVQNTRDLSYLLSSPVRKQSTNASVDIDAAMRSVVRPMPNIGSSRNESDSNDSDNFAPASFTSSAMGDYFSTDSFQGRLTDTSTVHEIDEEGM